MLPLCLQLGGPSRLVFQTAYMGCSCSGFLGQPSFPWPRLGLGSFHLWPQFYHTPPISRWPPTLQPLPASVPTGYLFAPNLPWLPQISYLSIYGSAMISHCGLFGHSTQPGVYHSQLWQSLSPVGFITSDRHGWESLIFGLDGILPSLHP